MTNGHGQANGRAAKTLITTYKEFPNKLGKQMSHFGLDCL